jgi:hypothetical protein
MRRALLIASVCALTAIPALADFTVTETGVNPSAAVTVSFYGSQVYAGVYRMTISGDGALNGNWGGFCIDVSQLSGSASNYNTSTLATAPIPGASMGDVRAGQVAWLLNKYWGASPDATTASALQAAVWEIINEKTDSTYNLASGNITVSGGGAATAAGWLNTINALTAGGYDWAGYGSAGYTALVSPTLQDYVIRVPAPAAVLLGMLGLAAAGRKLRRFV